MSDECEYCMFYLGEFGICRRFPPKLVKQGNTWTSGYPPVDEDMWCGEFYKQIGRREEFKED